MSETERPPVRLRERAVSALLVAVLALVAAIPLVALYHAFGPK